MTSDELRKVRSFYHSLTNFEPILERSAKTSGIVQTSTVNLLRGELDRISEAFPDLLPPLDLTPYARRNDPGYYYSEGVCGVLGLALGRLKVAIESTESKSVTEQRDFPFVREVALRRILERDYIETQKAFVAGCWKSVVILAGGAIEAILIDLLSQKETQAKASTKAVKEKEIRDWGLVYLILVAVDLKLILPGVEKLSHSIREYRDLIHPIVEIRSGLKIDAEEAKIAIEVLNMVYRDVSH